MSESARKKQRTTPRNSELPESLTEETLYTNLRQLASIAPLPITPFRRASSAGPGPTPGSRRTPTISIRTPGTAARTPRGPGGRPIPARRAAPTTPHAIRALRERANAARTPGNNRRRSGRVQRETPRDTLRDLSRVLARSTKPAEPSPLTQVPTPRHPAFDLVDGDDGPDPVAPRLSMPLGDMYDDDSFHLHEAPPRQSLLPELPDDGDTGTIHSLEFGRRAHSEAPRRLMSGEGFTFMNELGLVEEEEYEIDGTFINRLGPVDQLLQDAEDGIDDTTTEIRALTGRQDGRFSDVNLGVFGEEDDTGEPTFQFMIPQRIQAPPVPGVLQQIEDDEDVADLENALDAVVEDGVDDDDIDDAGAGAEVVGWESDDAADEDDQDLTNYRKEISAVDRSLITPLPERPISSKDRPRRQRKELKISNISGKEYPSFNPATVKSLATAFARSQGTKSKIGKDTLDALVQTTDWFFEQVGNDLAAYAQHAGRKMVEEADMIALMKRQRQITPNSTMFSLAQKMLPRELLQQLRMQPVKKLKGQKRKRMETIQEDVDEDES